MLAEAIDNQSPEKTFTGLDDYDTINMSDISCRRL